MCVVRAVRSGCVGVRAWSAVLRLRICIVRSVLYCLGERDGMGGIVGWGCVWDLLDTNQSEAGCPTSWMRVYVWS